MEGVDIEAAETVDDLIEAWRRGKKARRAKYLARDANNLFEPRMFTSLAVESEELRSPIRELREPTSRLPQLLLLNRCQKLRFEREHTSKLTLGTYSGGGYVLRCAPVRIGRAMVSI